MVGCITDITELKEKVSQLRNIANNIDGMVHRYQRAPDGHDEFIYVSEGVRDLHEVTPKEVLDDPGVLWSQIVDENIGEVKKSVDSSAQNLEKWNQKWKIETPSGRKKWIHGRGTPQKNDDGSIIWDTILLDITEQERAKNKQQELYRIIEESLNEVYIFETDSLEFVYINSLAREHTGYTEDQLQQMTPLDLIEGIETRQAFDKYLAALDRDNKEVVTFSTIHKRSDGTEYPVDVRLRKEEYNGKPVYVAVILDITNQKELEDHIKRQVSLLNHILDSIPGLFYMLGEDLTIARTNKNVEKLFGLSAEELQKTNALTLIAPREQQRAKRLVGKAFQEGYAELETILLDKDGNEHHYYMNGSRIDLAGKNYVIGSGIDVTKRIRTEEENRVLLQEVHHRVKNNLAIISGLLSLELQELSPDSYGQMPLERSINRIHSIAKVHELLYQSASFSYVNVKRYISELTDTAMNTLQKDENIDICLELDDIDMNINEVIPLGMLMNELLTNSLKYAFGEEEKGHIKINFCKNGDRYEAQYCDDGRGFNRRDFDNSETLGLTIVRMLLQQLEAIFEVDTEDGFEITFSFKEKKTGSHSNI
jgi:PAS domain S-box-containing protein